MGTLSTAGAYTMAKLGIYVAQKAMEVTGNNITNINTPGYTRQRLDQTSLYMGGLDRYSSKWEVNVGSGAIATGVTQLRSPYLDIRYRTEMSSVGSYQTWLQGLNQLASKLDEVGKGEDDEGIMEAAFNDLIAQLTNMSATGAGKDSYDTLVQGSARSLASLFNTYASSLETIRQNTERSFGEDVQAVNTILKKIQTLTDSIRKSDILGGDSLEMRDERNLLLDELSEYVAINVRYEEEKIGAGMTIERLIVELDSHERIDENGKSLGHDGLQLVNGQYVAQFEVHQVLSNPDDENSPLVYGPNYDMKVTEMRDMQNNIYDAGKDTESKAVWLTDNDLYGSLQATRELLTEKGEFATELDLKGDVNAANPYEPPYVQIAGGDNICDSDANIKRGIPYYQSALDLMARKFAESLNEANTLPTSDLYLTRKDANGDPVNAAGQPLYADVISGKYYVKDPNGELSKDADGNLIEGVPVFVDADDNEVGEDNRVANPYYSYYNGGPLFSNNGNGNDTSNITALNISISNAWATGQTKILQTKQPIDPDRPQSTLQDNIQHILSIVADNNMDYRPSDLYPDEANASASWNTAFFNGSFQDFFTDICETLADDISVSTSRANNYISAVNDLYGERDSISGVDLNDEAISMMQFNKAYSASCRLLTTLDEMIDKLVNGTAV